MGSRKNVLWINIVKAICIIGVFLVHSQTYYKASFGSVSLYITPFCVNTFFFISGYLLFRKQLQEPLITQSFRKYLLRGGKLLILNIFYRIVIPSVLFSMLEFLPSYMLRGKDFGVDIFLYKTIGGCTYWFTSALVVAELLIFLMLLTRQRTMWLYFLCSCLLCGLGMYLCQNKIDLFLDYPSMPWEYKQGLICILFLALGGLYWRLETYVYKLMNKKVLVFMIVFYFILLTFWHNLFHVSISTMNLNIAGVCICLLGTMILIETCKLVKHANLLNYIGQNTIVFYFMSGALPIVISMVIHRLIPGTKIYGCAIVFLVSMTISYVAVRLIKRYIPWMIDLRELWNCNTR